MASFSTIFFVIASLSITNSAYLKSYHPSTEDESITPKKDHYDQNLKPNKRSARKLPLLNRDNNSKSWNSTNARPLCTYYSCEELQDKWPLPGDAPKCSGCSSSSSGSGTSGSGSGSGSVSSSSGSGSGSSSSSGSGSGSVSSSSGSGSGSGSSSSSRSGSGSSSSSGSGSGSSSSGSGSRSEYYQRSGSGYYSGSRSGGSSSSGGVVDSMQGGGGENTGGNTNNGALCKVKALFGSLCGEEDKTKSDDDDLFTENEYIGTGTKNKRSSGTIESKAFNVSDCSSFSDHWIWDLALTCDDLENGDNCQCSTAEELVYNEVISCDDDTVCPHDCPICVNCLKLIGCQSTSQVDIQTIVGEQKSAVIPYVAAASIGLLLGGMAIYVNKKKPFRKKTSAYLQDDDMYKGNLMHEGPSCSSEEPVFLVPISVS